MTYTDYTCCDHDLFLALNFDGGPALDRLMLTVSGTWMWLPLYLLICWLILRPERRGAAGTPPAPRLNGPAAPGPLRWRNLLVFALLLGATLGLSDMIAGIFKANGLLGSLLPNFEPRWRPMFTPALEGLDIAPDSLRRLRGLAPDALAAAGIVRDWQVHVPVEAVSGRFGTVSAHAATITGLAVLSAGAVRRRWFTLLIVFCTVLICYSRIYLAKHFPLDLLWGALTGLVLGSAALQGYRRLTRPARRD